MYKAYNITRITLPMETSILSSNNIPRYVNDIVEIILDSGFVAFKHHRGATSYHPNMMLTILLYAYTQSIFPGRKIAKLLHNELIKNKIITAMKQDSDTNLTQEN